MVISPSSRFVQKARTWVDTGGGWFAITERLADDIGAQRKGAPFEDDEERAVDIVASDVYLGGLPLNLTSARTSAILGSDRISPGIDAEAFLPARADALSSDRRLSREEIHTRSCSFDCH